jgi:TRAP-type C4-dicarboxylate transport system permease small subunit
MSIKKILELASGLIAGISLMAIMSLTFIDVLGRKLFDHSLPGSLELTELLMVAVIFGALPLVSEKGEHIVFDSLDGLWPTWLRGIHLRVIHLACAAALIGLGWLMWQTGYDFQAAGEHTAQLSIPKAPFIFAMGLLCGFTGFIHLYYAIYPEAIEENESGVL